MSLRYFLKFVILPQYSYNSIFAKDVTKNAAFYDLVYTDQ